MQRVELARLAAQALLCVSITHANAAEQVFTGFVEGSVQRRVLAPITPELSRWLQAKESETAAFLRALPDQHCDEAIVLESPALHAAELTLTIGCRSARAAWMLGAIPGKRTSSLEQQPVDPAHWDRFMAMVSKWGPLPAPTMPVQGGWDVPTHEAFFKGHLALLGVYRRGAWTYVPLRGAEILSANPMAEHPDRPRWQVASALLMGQDPEQSDRAEAGLRQEMRATGEHDRLWRFIRDDDRVEFSRALARRKDLRADSPQMYGLIFFAIQSERNAMAAEILRSGTPIRSGRDPHPNLVAALMQADPCGDCTDMDKRNGSRRAIDKFLVVLSLAKLAPYSDPKSVETLGRELTRVTAATFEQAAAESLRSADDKNLLRVAGPQIEADARIAFAASFGTQALREALRGVYVDPRRRNAQGETLLFFALQDEKFADLALQLIEQGADTKAANTSFRVTPLMLAAGNATPAVVQQLLQRGCNPNQRSSDDSTALMYAASAGRIDNVRLLLEAGADAGAKDAKGQTALQMAQWQRHDELAAVIAAALQPEQGGSKRP